jgi:hypothetical protein
MAIPPAGALESCGYDSMVRPHVALGSRAFFEKWQAHNFWITLAPHHHPAGLTMSDYSSYCGIPLRWTIAAWSSFNG